MSCAGVLADQRFAKNPSMEFVFRTSIFFYVFMNTRYISVMQIKIYPQIWTNFLILSTETLRYRSPSSSDTWNDTLSPIPVASTPQPLHVLCNCLIPVLSMIFWALFSLTPHPAMISIWFPYFFWRSANRWIPSSAVASCPLVSNRSNPRSISVSIASYGSLVQSNALWNVALRPSF